MAGPKGDTTAAQLVVEDGATSITVRTADLGGDLYRVSTPAGAGIAPSVVHDGNQVQVFLHGDGSGPAAVTVLLADSVKWGLRLDGGASDLVANLGSGKVSGVDLVAGNAHISLDLPKPTGTVPVKMSGGASEFAINVKGSAPVRVVLDAGAGSAILDGTSHTGIAGGTVFNPPAWATASDRYDVIATGGVSSLTLNRD